MIPSQAGVRGAKLRGLTHNSYNRTNNTDNFYDKANGEIVKVVSVVGAVVTIVRETSQFGAPNTGLRWDHTSNVGAGTLYAYLCDRTDRQYHDSCFDFSAGTRKDFTRMLWSVPRGMNANNGLIVRSQDGTDGTTCVYNVTAIYRD